MPMRDSDPTLGEVGQLEFRIEIAVIDKGGHEQVKETIKEHKNVRCFVLISCVEGDHKLPSTGPSL
jgi:hypothetical protein